MATSSVRVTANGNVAELTLIRPELMNRFDDVLLVDLVDALHEVRVRDELRAVVLASSGPVFSAGGDFELIRALHYDRLVLRKMGELGRELLMTLIDLPVPVVAALHGDAVGVGATVILSCDAVVAPPGASLRDPHVLVGLVPGEGGCLVWPQAVGMLRARRYLLTGDPISATDACAMGLVTDLVDSPDEVLPAARRLAARMAALPPLAVQGTKRALNLLVQQRACEVVDLALAHSAFAAGSDDVLEAIAAFKEKRPGQFSGR